MCNFPFRTDLCTTAHVFTTAKSDKPGAVLTDASKLYHSVDKTISRGRGNHHDKPQQIPSPRKKYRLFPLLSLAFTFYWVFLSATHSLCTLSVSEQDLGSTLVDLSQECELCQLSNCPQVAPCLGK